MTTTAPRTPHVVILGGGFGGLAAARDLSRAKVQVTLIDRRNHHLFQPLLYQVATASLAPSDIAEPIRSILASQENVRVRLAEVVEVDAEGKRVAMVSMTEPDAQPEWLTYDYLVVALGVSQSWFGNDSWAEAAPGLKTLRDALDIRRRILTAFERAEWCTDPETREALLTFVVVGAGPTGVELAGAIAEIALTTFRKDFRNIDTRNANVILIEAGPAVLASYTPPMQQKAREQLESLGVDVRLDTRVEGVDDQGVDITDGRIEACTVLWAAGVKAPALGSQLGSETDRVGRVHVGPDTSIPAHPEIFVAGDMAHFEGEEGPLPGVAPVAIGMGRHAAGAILADLSGASRKRYVYKDKGQMATIGRRRAVLESGRIRFAGTLAWLAWVFVHLMVLVTYRNRALVFMKWAWAWLTYERASRLLWHTEPAPGDAVATHAAGTATPQQPRQSSSPERKKGAHPVGYAP